MDEGFLGFDTRSPHNRAELYTGVGCLPGASQLKAISLTTSDEDGDFRPKVAGMNIPIGDYPVVLVIKKNVRILKHVRNWIVALEGRQVANGKQILCGIPVLVIDAEAGNASVNVATADDDAKLFGVNAAMRHLLESFEKTAYIGYRTSLFANTCIKPDVGRDDYGSHSLPYHFIETLSLNPPCN